MEKSKTKLYKVEVSEDEELLGTNYCFAENEIEACDTIYDFFNEEYTGDFNCNRLVLKAEISNSFPF